MNNSKKIRITLAILLCATVLFQLTTFSFGQACTVPSEPEVKLDVNVDVGSTHFRGEMAEFYILVSLSGSPIDPQTIKADLYFNGNYSANLTSAIRSVSVGLYRVTYAIPTDASAGTYALEVNACYSTVNGTALKCFLISQTLTNLNAWLTDITGTIATIKTDIGMIQVSLDNLNAKLTSIDERSVIIQTDIGVIKTDLNTINASIININDSIASITTTIGQIDVILDKVTVIEGNTVEIMTSLGKINGTITQIQGDIATIKTDIGDIKVTLLSMKNSQQDTSNPNSLWWILVVVIAIAVITVLGLVVKIRKDKTSRINQSKSRRRTKKSIDIKS